MRAFSCLTVTVKVSLLQTPSFGWAVPPVPMMAKISKSRRSMHTSGNGILRCFFPQKQDVSLPLLDLSTVYLILLGSVSSDGKPGFWISVIFWLIVPDSHWMKRQQTPMLKFIDREKGRQNEGFIICMFEPWGAVARSFSRPGRTFWESEADAALHPVHRGRAERGGEQSGECNWICCKGRS